MLIGKLVVDVVLQVLVVVLVVADRSLVILGLINVFV